jgi:hypothetical protein
LRRRAGVAQCARHGPDPKLAPPVNRFLLLITPGSQATLLAGALAAFAFGLGLLEMLSRDFDMARLYLYLSIGIVAYVVLLKFFSFRASHVIVDQAQAQIRRHVQNLRKVATGDNTKDTAQLQRTERAHMAELTSELKSALQSLPPDSPMRPKYEATVTWLERALARGS